MLKSEKEAQWYSLMTKGLKTQQTWILQTRITKIRPKDGSPASSGLKIRKENISIICYQGISSRQCK